MSDDYKIQLSVKAGQDMLNVRANTADELQGIVDDAKTRTDLSRFFKPEVVKAPAVTVQDITDETKPPSDIEALANIEKHLGTSEMATPAQIAVLTKRLGVSYDEAKSCTKAQAGLRIAASKKEK